jgi:hypothetical protein
MNTIMKVAVTANEVAPSKKRGATQEALKAWVGAATTSDGRATFVRCGG